MNELYNLTLSHNFGLVFDILPLSPEIVLLSQAEEEQNEIESSGIP